MQSGANKKTNAARQTIARRIGVLPFESERVGSHTSDSSKSALLLRLGARRLRAYLRARFSRVRLAFNRMPRERLHARYRAFAGVQDLGRRSAAARESDPVAAGAFGFVHLGIRGFEQAFRRLSILG
jgi:hypothetical protein